MAEVTLDIAGRQYAVACRDGGEAHLRKLGELVSAKAREASGAVGTVNETRQLLFAALLLADHVVEGLPPAVTPAADDEALARLADRLERIADALETGPPNA